MESGSNSSGERFRIDDIVRFRALSQDDMLPIVDIQLQHLVRRLADRRITLEVTPAARGLLAKLGYDPTFGARPLKRTIQSHLADKLAIAVLDGSLHEDDTMVVDADADQLTFRTVRAAA